MLYNIYRNHCHLFHVEWMSLRLKRDFVIPSYGNSLLSKSDPAYEDYHLCHSNFSTKLITEWNFSWQIQATVVLPLISTLMLIQFWSFNDSSLLKGGVLQRGRSLFQSRTYNLYEFSFQLTIDKICNIIVSYIPFSNFPWKGNNWHCKKPNPWFNSYVRTDKVWMFWGFVTFYCSTLNPLREEEYCLILLVF